MTKYSLVLLVALFTLKVATVRAQQQSTFFMNNNPYSTEINPSKVNYDGKFHIGFPGLSSLELGMATNGFAYSDLIHYGTGEYADSLVMDFDNFNSKLKKNNYLVNEMSRGILNFGFRVKEKGYLSFALNNKFYSQSRFDQDLITTMLEGNKNRLGETINFGLGQNGIAYNEFVASYAHQHDEHWSFGGSLKFLTGIGAVRSNNLSLDILTAEDGRTIDLRATGDVEISGPVSYELNDEGGIEDFKSEDYDFGSLTSNNGLAIDLGATYTFNDKFEAGISVVDLGFIKWKKQVTTISQEGHFVYEGVDLSNSLNEDDPDYKEMEDLFDEVVDDLEDSFKFKEGGNSSFTSYLPTKIYLNGSYKVCDALKLGALSRFRFFDDRVGASLTLSANTAIRKWLNFSTSYGMYEGNYSNLGLGLGVKAGAIQYFVSTDNILALDPSNTRSVNARFGLNFLFGRNSGKNEDF